MTSERPGSPLFTAPGSVVSTPDASPQPHFPSPGFTEGVRSQKVTYYPCNIAEHEGVVNLTP